MKFWIWFQILAWTVAHHFCFHAHCKLLMGIHNSPFIFPIVSNMLPKSKEYGLCIASSTFQVMFVGFHPSLTYSSWMTQHHLIIGWWKFKFFFWLLLHCKKLPRSCLLALKFDNFMWFGGLVQQQTCLLKKILNQLHPCLWHFIHNDNLHQHLLSNISLNTLIKDN
jgi:hypothetical protein